MNRHFSSHARVLAALMLWALPGGSQAPGWQGTYTPVSSVCAKSPLIVAGGSFSYMDCTKLKLSVVRTSATELLFDAGPGKCSLSNWAFALTREGADVMVRAYRSADERNNGRPSFECTYEFKPSSSRSMAPRPSPKRARLLGDGQ